MAEERRVVTVLFADVAGSTALGDVTDPEDLRALMAAYYAVATRVIGEHGGTLEKFIGDAIMAVFGVPQAHDDDPDRALGAAVALRQAVASETATSALMLRIGVNTGEVIAARDPRRDFLVTGDAVNVAARLQQAATPGEIVAGERTIAAVGPRFHFAASQALDVKGKPEPIRCAVLERIATEGPARRSAGPFVGRESDLAQLMLAGRRAFDESRPQLVTISAPAGTGKSRLVEEFERRVRAERGSLRSATAQCLPFGAAITYLPMRGLLAGLLDVPAGELSIDAVARALAGRGVESAEAVRVATLVGATLGLDAEIGDRDREEFFAAWRAAVEGLAGGTPTLLVLEDLHWASESLLDLIEHVVQPRTRAPLLMVALTRPELFDRRTTWGTGRRNTASIALDPLADDETRALVSALMPDAGTSAHERIASRAEGNPFFAAELARSYREHGDAAELPDTVQATMLARLDLLPEQERRTLQLGAVVGRTIRPAAVALLLGATGDRSLAALAERDLLIPQADGSYAFRHIVIRDVAYGTLPRSERARAHLTIARWLDGLGDAGPELVAHHYRQTLLHSPRALEDPAEISRAVASLERAALFAKRTGADREAVALLKDALRIAPDADRMRLHERIGDAMELTDEATEEFAEAYRFWEALPSSSRDNGTGARLLRKRLLVDSRWGGSVRKLLPVHESFALFRRARELGAADQYESARLDVLELFMARRTAWIADLAIEHRPSGERARTAALAARAEFARRGDLNAESEALDALGNDAQRGGRYTEAIATARERMTLGDTSLLERGDAAAMVSGGLMLAGDFDGALTAFDRHVESLRPGEPEGFYPYPHALAAGAARIGGRWDDAIRICDRLAALWDTQDRGIRAPVAILGWIAGLYISRARMDEPRVQRFRAAGTQLAIGIDPESALLSLWRAFGLDDAHAALDRLATRAINPVHAGELLALLLFDHDVAVGEDVLARVDAEVTMHSPVVDERLRLVRGAHSGPVALRDAITSLERAGIHGDVARAAGLLARMTGDPKDRAEAERRLKAMGDHAYVARLAEPVELRDS